MFIPKYMSTFGVFWFVSTLFQFYIMFYAICAFRNLFRNIYAFLATCTMIGFIWQLILYLIYGNVFIRVLNGSMIQYLPVFVLGMVVAENLYEGKDIIETLPTWIIGVSAIMFLGLDYLMVTGPIKAFGAFNDIPDTIGFIALMVFIYRISNIVIRNLVIQISKFGYELYLMHIIVMTIVFSLFGNGTVLTTIASTIISIFASIIIAYFYKRLWEKVFLLGHRKAL